MRHEKKKPPPTLQICNQAAKLVSEFPVTGDVKKEETWQLVEMMERKSSISRCPWRVLLSKCPKFPGTAESVVSELW